MLAWLGYPVGNRWPVDRTEFVPLRVRLLGRPLSRRVGRDEDAERVPGWVTEHIERFYFVI